MKLQFGYLVWIATTLICIYYIYLESGYVTAFLILALTISNTMISHAGLKQLKLIEKLQSSLNVLEVEVKRLNAEVERLKDWE